MQRVCKMCFNAHPTINYDIFVKEETFNGKEIFISATNILILAMVRLLVSERIRAS